MLIKCPCCKQMIEVNAAALMGAAWSDKKAEAARANLAKANEAKRLKRLAAD